MAYTIDPGSFKDAHGVVFSEENKVFRSIFAPGAANFEKARDKDIYQKLIDKNLLLNHSVENINRDMPQGTVHCISQKKLPFISYPWEWPFSMLQDAAQIHLEIMRQLLPEGFWLRDANPFNIQYDSNRLKLIDTLSIGKRPPGSPWVAYAQFCSNFLAPLVLAAHVDVRLLSMWRTYISGFPLDLAAKLLPARKKIHPGIFMHLLMHARIQAKESRKEVSTGKAVQSDSKVKDTGLSGIIESLHSTVCSLKVAESKDQWEDYSETRTYNDSDRIKKADYLDSVLTRIKPETVWDIGSNKGEYSLLAASKGAFVISIDSSHKCINEIYNKLTKNVEQHSILPLVMDVANPSPGSGWEGKERYSLEDRGPADLTFALALIHHIVFTHCIPLEKAASWFAKISKNLIIELVPGDDPMVKLLLTNRSGEHLPYSPELFISAFGKYFTIQDNCTLSNNRILYFMKRI